MENENDQQEKKEIRSYMKIIKNQQEKKKLKYTRITEESYYNSEISDNLYEAQLINLNEYIGFQPIYKKEIKKFGIENEYIHLEKAIN